MSEMISRDSLVEVLKLLKNNTRLSSIKSLAAAGNTTPDVINALLEAFKTTTYVVIRTFPKGNFKNYGFTRYGEGFIYTDGFAVVENGRLVEGSFSRMASPLPKYVKAQYQNRAVEYGLKLITYMGFSETLLEDMYQVLNKDYLEAKDLAEKKEALDAKYKPFEGYPLALAQYQQQELKIAQTESKIQELTELDATLKKDYERQLYLAEHGQRTKRESYSVQVGTERICTGSYRAKYWFDDEGTLEYNYETVPTYETRYRTVVDMPVEPTYHDKEIYDLQYDLRNMGYQLQHIKSSIVTIEKHLQKEAQDALDHEQYKKERRELDKKYGGRFK